MKVIGRFLFLIAAFAGFFLVGFFVRDAFAKEAPNGKAFARLMGNKSAQKTPTEVFSDNLDIIAQNAAVQPDPLKLRYSAMSGLVSSLGDPHTNFLEPVVAEALALDTRGNFQGIGARLGGDPLGAKVGTVFRDGPAKKAGLQPNDIITGVDGLNVSGMVVDEIVEKIKGPEGTRVVLTVMRESASEPIRIPITRAVVLIPTAEGKMLPNKVGYVQVSGFSELTAKQFKTELNALKQQGMQKLVIDLRSNPGGLLNAAADMLSYFFADKPVVTMKGRNGDTQTARTNKGQVIKLPQDVVILINEDSASASEIFSGVMQDYGRAKLVGTHSYGKASVQELRQLPEGATAKITIAKYFIPSGRDISRKLDEDGDYISGGLKPDYEVELELTEKTEIGNPEQDSQLKRALEILGIAG
ncbi:MAG: S41 family peptidase [Armatimonadetes bacterium]|nr:S41 family peptidase [Armatimonadota bacterium]